MAGFPVVLNQSVDITTGTTLKTILQHRAPTSSKLRIPAGGASISFDGNSPTANKILTQLVVSNADGTATTRNPAKVNQADGSTVRSSGKEDFSAEPTGKVVVFERLVHPQGECVCPFVVEVAEGKAISWQTTAPAAVDARAQFYAEE